MRIFQITLKKVYELCRHDIAEGFFFILCFLLWLYNYLESEGNTVTFIYNNF